MSAPVPERIDAARAVSLVVVYYMLLISDIHGSVSALEKVLAWFEKLECRNLIILGDVLNHGPRNPIPEGYDPSSVARLLNDYANRVVAVRGNCDGEVDQMLCTFPLTADYNWLIGGQNRMFLTHGHLFGPHAPPPLSAGDAIAYGHTHVPVAEWRDQVAVFNPGSVTFPKEGFVASFGYFDGSCLKVLALETGEELGSLEWGGG